MKVGRLLSDNTFIPGGVYDCSLPEQTFFYEYWRAYYAVLRELCCPHPQQKTRKSGMEKGNEDPWGISATHSSCTWDRSSM